MNSNKADDCLLHRSRLIYLFTLTAVVYIHDRQLADSKIIPKYESYLDLQPKLTRKSNIVYN